MDRLGQRVEGLSGRLDLFERARACNRGPLQWMHGRPFRADGAWSAPAMGLRWASIPAQESGHDSERLMTSVSQNCSNLTICPSRTSHTCSERQRIGFAVLTYVPV